MGDIGQRSTHIKDVTDVFAAIESHALPAVSFVKPDGLLDGHPASPKVDLFEGMLANSLRVGGKLARCQVPERAVRLLVAVEVRGLCTGPGSLDSFPS
jgi:hypothetical protein